MGDLFEGAPVADQLVAEALAAGQRVSMRVATGSMMPLLRPGDLVTACGESAKVTTKIQSSILLPEK